MKIAALYEKVTNRIIHELETGVIPWVKPWKNAKPAGSLMPHNFATGHAYRGINIPLLWDQAARHGYDRHLWLTYKQAEELSGQVRKGEKGTHIVFTKKITVKGEDEDSKKLSMLKTFCVFNVAQVDGLKEWVLPEFFPATRDGRLDTFIAKTNAVVRHAGNQAMFVPHADFIIMPNKEQFKSDEGYYATALHELSHWSGHKSRLDRDLSGRFGTRKYAAEELVAELGAAFLCAHLGIEGELRHAGYIQTWIELLKHDDRAIFTAASKASQAADYLRAFSEVVAKAA